jgi:hypothetical protein
MGVRVVVLAILVSAAPAWVAAGPVPVKWQAFADCAAAYQANARIVDPSRPASMTAMISDTAKDYEAAALDRYRQYSKIPADAAVKAVRDYIAKRTQGFGRQPRAAVEKFIDACPQTDG